MWNSVRIHFVFHIKRKTNAVPLFDRCIARISSWSRLLIQTFRSNSCVRQYLLNDQLTLNQFSYSTSAKKLYERTGGIRENPDDLLYVFPINQIP